MRGSVVVADLPVAVRLPAPLAAEVVAWVEGDLGWQVVDGDGPLQPVMVLADRPGAPDPWIAVHAGEVDGTTAREALRAGAIDVVTWPGERQRVVAAVDGLRRQRTASGENSALIVAGLAGGVGTSTVALAIGGVLAWSGARTVVIGGDDMLGLAGLKAWTGPGMPELAALRPTEAAREIGALARDVPGVAGLRAIGGGWHPVGTGGWPVDAVVVDARSPHAPSSADLLVARPDRGLARGRDLSLPVLVVGDGALNRSQATRLLSRPPVVWLPASARVARAGLAGRVPAGLPGTWLRSLRQGLYAVVTPGWTR